VWNTARMSLVEHFQCMQHTRSLGPEHLEDGGFQRCFLLVGELCFLRGGSTPM
jgi:hypothetical protein